MGSFLLLYNFFHLKSKSLVIFQRAHFLLLWITFCHPVFFKLLPLPCILFKLGRSKSEDDRPNYERTNIIELELDT
jgi:hypothetical protein